MIELLRRLRGRSVTELRVRSTQYVSARVERLALDVGLPAPHATERFSLAPLVILRPDSREPVDVKDLPQALRESDTEVHAAAQHWSDETRAGRLHLLGHGPVTVGNPPRWHRDPISGRESPRVHWSRVPYLDVDVVGDHKALWEPNRHQYLYATALAWLAESRSDEFLLMQAHLRSWLEENPFRVGVNWASSLEVAYRAITWCWLLRLTEDAAWDPTVRDAMARSLANHGAHIERYLSTYFSPNTHLTGEALGLLYIGTVVPATPRAPIWRELGAEILERALEQHVREDGTYFEQASQYHRYTAEIYLHYMLVARAGGRGVGSRVGQALNNLFDVLRSLADARGRIPPIGDDDGGALFPVDLLPPDDVRSLLLAGAVALGRPELAFPGASPLMATALCGRGATLRTLERAAVPGWRDRAFSDGGLYVLRDGWHSTAAVAVVDAGVHGAMNCGHAHADALAMTLTLGERPLFVDRGTLTYTGPERNEFRSTCSHNTVEIDDESSAEPGTAFAWRSIPPPPHATVGASGHLRWVSAVSRGHTRSARASVHRRVVLDWIGGPWIVLDRVSRQGLRKASARWYLAPGARPAMERAGVVHVVTEHTVSALASVAFPCSDTLELENRDVSSRLGSRTPSTVIIARADATGRVLTLVVGGEARWVADEVPGHRDAAWSCVSGEWVHTVALRPEGISTWCPFGVDSDAELAWRIEPRGVDKLESARLCLVAARTDAAANGLLDERDGIPFAVGVLERVAGVWEPLPSEEFGKSAME